MAGNAELQAALAQAVAMVRRARLDDVVLLLPWSATHAVNACADRLMTMPVSVQLGPETIFDRFSEIHLSRLGPAIMLNLDSAAAHAHRGAVEARRRFRMRSRPSGRGLAGAVARRSVDQARLSGAGVVPPVAAWLQSEAVQDHQAPHHVRAPRTATAYCKRRATIRA